MCWALTTVVNTCTSQTINQEMHMAVKLCGFITVVVIG